MQIPFLGPLAARFLHLPFLMTKEAEEHPEAPVPVHPGRDERQHMTVVVLLVLSAFAAYVLGRFFWPFISGIVIALVLAMLAFPAYERLARRMPDTLAALLATTVLILLVVIPLAGITTILFTSIQDNVDTISEQLGELTSSGGPVQDALDWITSRVGMHDIDLGSRLSGQVEALGGFLAGGTLGIVTGLGGVLVQAGVAIFTLYYLLEDGHRLVHGLGRYVPLDDRLLDALVARTREITFATVYGHVVVAAVQGVLGGLTWWALGLPGPALWGTVMLIFSLLPAIGTPVVWGPAAIVLLVQGHVTRGLILLAVGTLVISTVDNVLRSWLVADRAQLHPLGGFFSVLGGLVLFGLIGLFLGPMVFVLALMILEVTRQVLRPDRT